MLVRKQKFALISALIIIFFIAFIVRAYYGFEPATREGAPFLYSGGSDSYYHARAIDHFQAASSHLIGDDLLNYPIGMKNPRPPIFSDGIALTGLLLAPLFNNSVVVATSYVFIFSTAFFGALTIFPIYLLGAEIFSRKAGVAAAILLAISAGHIERSVLTNADHDSMALFFIVLGLYFFVKSIKLLDERKWVENWSEPTSVIKGIHACLLKNKRAFLYAGLAGVSNATVALIWLGFDYLVAILTLFFIIQLFIYRFKKADPTSLLIAYSINIGFCMLIAFPSYFATGFVKNWWDAPFYMYLAIVGFGILLCVTREHSWLLVIPLLLVSIFVGLFLFSTFLPSSWFSVIGGLGVIIKSKLTTTIAEAQFTDFSRLALSFGIVSFFLAIAGVFIAIYTLRKKWNNAYFFAVVWSFAAMYMSLSQARFVFNASPPVALMGGWVLAIIISKFNFPEVKKTYSIYSGRKLYAIRKSIKLMHIAGVLFTVFLIVVPNMWYAVDAGIPFDTKREYDKQIYHAMPFFVRPPGYDAINGSIWYFGAFGYDLPTAASYWPAGYAWLAKQDSNIRVAGNRPAFLSWWDYGFEAAQQGKHPTVADNFQLGYPLAGSFITATSEEDGIALFIARIMEGDFIKHGRKPSEPVKKLLLRYGFDVGYISDVLGKPEKYPPVVLANPQKYGYYSDDLSSINAMYAVIRELFVSKLGKEGVVNFYKELRQATGKSIRYFAIDSRLFPFSGMNTGIFYAPAKLSDKRMAGADKTIPIDFYKLKAVSELGGEYDIEDIPAGVRIVDYKIEYQPAFYKTMLYRTFIGYSGADIGKSADAGVPGLTGELATMKPMPGWNLTHFRVVYQTAYWNPYKDVENHTADWRAVSYDDAIEYQKLDKGIVDLSPRSSLSQGVTFIKYYDGALIKGQVRIENGTPLPNVWVTIADKYSIPHHCVKTDKNGLYELYAPFGNVTLTASVGELTPLTKIGDTTLKEYKFDITDAQAMRETDDWVIKKDFVIEGATVKGTAYWDIDKDGNYTTADEKLKCVTIKLENEKLNFTSTCFAEKGLFEFKHLAPGDYTLKLLMKNREFKTQVSVEKGSEKSSNIGVKPAVLNCTFYEKTMQSLKNLKVELTDLKTFEKMCAIIKNNTVRFTKLLPGSYKMTILSNRFTLPPLTVDLKEGDDQNRNITVYESAVVKGCVGFANATIFFKHTLNDELSKTVVTDSKGYYETTISKGDYNVQSYYYTKADVYAHISRLNVENDCHYNFTYRKSNFVAGIVYHENITTYKKSNVEIVFINTANEGVVAAKSDENGIYRIYLPPSEYRVQVSSGIEEGYAYLAVLSITSNTTYNINLKKGFKVSGYVYFDENRNNSRDADEALSGVQLTFKNKNSAIIYTNETGGYELYLPADDYVLTISKKGFMTTTRSFSVKTVRTVDFSLNPHNITVSGSVNSKVGEVFENLNITFKPKSNLTYALEKNCTSKGGRYLISLAPGLYNITIDQFFENNTIHCKYEGELTIPIGAGAIQKDLLVSKFIKISGKVETKFGVSVNIEFKGAEEKTITTSADGDFETYLMPSAYNVSILLSISNTNYVYLRNHLFLCPTKELKINLVEGISLNGNVYFTAGTPIQDMPIKITALDADKNNAVLLVKSDRNGKYVTHLPAGNYSLIVNHPYLDKIKNADYYMRYLYQSTVQLAGVKSKQVDIKLNRIFDNTTIYGSVRGSANELLDATIGFVAGGPPAINATFVSKYGKYNGLLAPGNYTVYVAHSDNAYLGSLKIPSPTDKTYYNITLKKSYKLSGSLLCNGELTMGELKIVSLNGTLTVGAKPYYSIMLPPAIYNISASIFRQEYGMAVEYRGNATVNLTKNIKQDLNLRRVNTYNVKLDWDHSQMATIEVNQSVVYTVTVANIGNAKDTYKFSGTPADWKFEFLHVKDLVLLPTEKAEIRVRIQAPVNAKVEHEEVKIKVTSENDASAEVEVEIKIKQFYGVKLNYEFGKLVYKDNEIKHTVRIENKGNGADSYQAKILNTDLLKKAGWQVSLKYGDKNGLVIDYINITAFSTGSVELVATAIAHNPVNGAECIVCVYSKNTLTAEAVDTIRISLVRPIVGTDETAVKISGAPVGEPTFNVLPYITVALLLFIIGSIVVMAIRRRRWQKRTK